MSNLASSTSSGQTGAFSLVIPATTYCAGSDVEGEVLLEFPQVQDEMIDEVTVELRGKLKVYAFSSCLCRTRSDRLLCRPQLRATYGAAKSFDREQAAHTYQDVYLETRIRVPPARFPCPSTTVQLPSPLGPGDPSVRVLGRMAGLCHGLLPRRGNCSPSENALCGG